MAEREIDALRRIFAALPPGSNLTAAELRKGFEGLMAIFPPDPDLTVDVVSAGGVAGELVAASSAAADRVVLYVHGGGYVMGSPASYRNLAGAIGRAANSRVLTVDYRLAPEHLFPAALEDVVAAYRSLFDQGIPAAQLAVAGDSSGGGLAVSLLTTLRERGYALPAAAACLSPYVDLQSLGASIEEKAAEDPILTRSMLLGMAQSYFAGTDLRSPAVSPLHADLRELPPLLIQVGSAEILLDDAVGLARRAGAAAVKTRLEIWPEMLHVFQLYAPMLSAGREAIAGIGAFLQTEWAR
jgi:acetyl esterase/lipase